MVAACAVGSEGITEEGAMATEINEAATVLNSKEGGIEAEDRADAITIRQRVQLKETLANQACQFFIYFFLNCCHLYLFIIMKQ